MSNNKLEKMDNILTKLIVNRTSWINKCSLSPLDGEDINSGIVVKYNVNDMNTEVLKEMEKICRETERIFRMLETSVDLRFYRTSFATDGYEFSHCDSGRPLV